MFPWWPLVLVVLSSTTLQGAPFTTNNPEADLKGLNTKLDSSVEELEKLKVGGEPHAEAPVKPTLQRLEVHNTDVVKQNGEVVSLVEQQSTADAVSGIPGAVGGARGADQDGDPTHTTTPATDTTTKVFHGAARLVQPGAASQPVHRPAHLAVRRSNSQPETQYLSLEGVWSPAEVARYVYRSGDQRTVTDTVQDYIRRGLMSKEEAISFLQEIKFNLEYLKANDADTMYENRQQLPFRNIMLEQSPIKETSQFRYPSVMRAFKRSSVDPMLENNFIGVSDFDKDPPAISPEELSEMLDRLRIADSLYTQYTLEEIIYQLAKMMFSMSLSRDRSETGMDRTGAGLRRFTALLQTEADRGRISPRTQKDITEVMIAALSDVLADHPELTQTHGTLTQTHTSNRLLSRVMEESDPAMSRAVLAAFTADSPTPPHLLSAFTGDSPTPPHHSYRHSYTERK